MIGLEEHENNLTHNQPFHSVEVQGTKQICDADMAEANPLTNSADNFDLILRIDQLEETNEIR